MGGDEGEMTRGSRLRPLARAALRTQSDDRLVALVREGRDAAFDEIVRRYRPGLVAFAAAYAPPDRIEDVVQDSLVRSWQALGQATEEIHLKPWLYTIVRNRALNARRDARTHAPLTDDIDGVPQPPDLVLSKAELAAAVSAVNALPAPQRQALVRSAVEGHTHEQIAAALGSSPGSVRQLIYRARLSLRAGVGALIPLPLVRLLAEQGGDGAAAASGVAALGAAGGASLMTKIATVAAIGTVAAGAGLAIERGVGGSGAAAQERQASSGQTSQRGSSEASNARAGGDQQPLDESFSSGSAPAGGSDSDDADPGHGGSSSGSGPGPPGGDDDADDGDSSGPGGGEDDDEPEHDEDDDNGGPGGKDDDEPEPEPDDDDDDGTGDGEGHSGTGGGDDDDELEPPADDSSGPGGGEDDDDELEPAADDDHSGPGGGGEPDDD
jgi:RNA polymerase sigma factor (sigma-70 family)